MTTATVYDSRIGARRSTGAMIAVAISLMLGIGIVYVGIELYEDPSRRR
jgi:hypothetical protein